MAVPYIHFVFLRVRKVHLLNLSFLCTITSFWIYSTFFSLCVLLIWFFLHKEKEIRSQESVSILCSFKYFWNATPLIPRILLTLNWLAEPANRTSYLSAITYPSIILLKTCLTQKIRRMSDLGGNKAPEPLRGATKAVKRYFIRRRAFQGKCCL